MPINQLTAEGFGMLSGSGGASFTGLLDTYPNAAAAYSVRRLSSDYATPTDSEFSFGDALRFDGANDYTSTPLSSIELGTSFTIGTWIKLDSSIGVSDCIYMLGGAPNDNTPYIYVEATSTGIRFYVNQNYRMSITINKNEWYYVSLNYQSSNWSVFVNGISVASYSGGLGAFASSNLYIGGPLAGNSKITIDEFSVWTQELTPTQNLNQYNSDLGNFANLDVEPLLWYNCNETDGATTLVNSGSGGATYNGTLINFDFATCWVDGKANKGALLEIRRSSDNLVKNFYYDSNNELSLNSKDWNGTTLSSWIGSDDGFVSTWYDQSGNAYDATQITTSAQPQIVSSGVISNKNSKPAIDFSGGNWELDANAAASEFAGTDVNFDAFSVLSGDGSSSKEFFSLAAASGNTTSLQLRTNGIDFVRVYIRDNASATNDKTTTTQITNQSLVSVLGTPSDYNIYVDGTADAGNPNTASLGLCSFAKATIGNDARAVSAYWGGTIQELVFYNTGQSTNQTGIESNINSYYSIYSPPSGIGTWTIGTTFIIQ